MNIDVAMFKDGFELGSFGTCCPTPQALLCLSADPIEIYLCSVATSR